MLLHIRKEILSLYSDNNVFIKKTLKKFLKNNELFVFNKETNNLKTRYFIYGKNTVNLTKNFINLFKEAPQPLKIFGKRINENTIYINISNSDKEIFLINTIYDKIPDNKNMLRLHYYLHRLSFADIYNINENDINYLFSINLKIGDKRIYKKFIPEIESNKILWIGSNISNEIYSTNYKKVSYKELIYLDPSSFFQFIKSFRKRWVLHKSDFEFRNLYAEIYDKGTLKYKVYNGSNYCYPFRLINNTKVGTMILISKFLVLNAIFDSTKITFDEIVNNLSKFDIKCELFKKCMGKSVSSYRKYYQRNWLENHKKPWIYGFIKK
jgi:hypothetical protein